jgi:sulfite oxidase
MSLALAAQWALHAADGRVPFAPFSMAAWLVRHTAGGLATTAIDVLGHWTLRTVTVGSAAIALAAGALLGRFPPHVVAAVVAAATLVAARLDPGQPSVPGGLISATVAAVAVLMGGAVLQPHRAEPAPNDGRRSFLALVGRAAGALVLGGGALRRLLEGVPVGAVSADVAAGIPDDPGFRPVPGLTPAVTSRDDHYVVDVNIDPPRIENAGWRLRAHGSVERPLSLSLDDLRAMTTVEELAMLSCISNTVGGGLTGNVRWTGVRLADLLDRAHVRTGAAAVRAAAADGYEDTIPMGRVRRPEMLVAIAMDGLLLPTEHGRPARLIVPGLYGMKNVKWLTELEVLSTDQKGYWEERGWDLRAETRTESRIDVPGDHDVVPSTFAAAGVAWAGDRRISRVEVSLDEGRSWRPAQLEGELGPFSWRRWQIELHVEPGTHPLTVRAYDGAGRVQEAERRPPHPSGASGYHRIVLVAQRVRT